MVLSLIWFGSKALMIGGDLFEVFMPLGGRSARNLHQDSGVINRWMQVDDCGHEYRLLRDAALDPSMSPAEHADAKTKLYDVIMRAKSGHLDFEARKPEAKCIELPGYQHLIELRPKPGAPKVFGRTARLIRLYYVEPLWQDDQLVALHIATKPDGPDSQEEQNSAIRTAGTRADYWNNYARQLGPTSEEGSEHGNRSSE